MLEGLFALMDANPSLKLIQRMGSRPDPIDLEVEKDAVALFQMADELYTHERYAVRPD